MSAIRHTHVRVSRLKIVGRNFPKRESEKPKQSFHQQQQHEGKIIQETISEVPIIAIEINV